jgi:hypothetical protein
MTGIFGPLVPPPKPPKPKPPAKPCRKCGGTGRIVGKTGVPFDCDCIKEDRNERD